MDPRYSLSESDPLVARIIDEENARQRDVLRLIPSENYASSAVLAATGSCLTNKYSEGYAQKRYYQGQALIDEVEQLAISRAKKVFGADHVNVQPYSGSPANLAVYFALLEQGDTILSMSLPHGGHLTHGWKVTISGHYYNAFQYGVRRDNQRIDMDEVARMAHEHKPKLIICGASAYPRTIDFEGFAQIAQDVGAYLLADIAHISGLVAGGAHPSPVPYADVISTTTHKTLRGPRGGMIMCKADHAKKIDRAVFPGMQGGPHNHTTAALAVALGEADSDEFRNYAHQVVRNSKVLAERLMSHDFDLVSGGTDNHLILIDLTGKNVSGKEAASALEACGIVCNANSVPFDPRKPFDPSGIRIGTPALTSRGMGEDEMKRLGDWMNSAIAHRDNPAQLTAIQQEIKEMCSSFPAPGIY